MTRTTHPTAEGNGGPDRALAEKILTGPEVVDAGKALALRPKQAAKLLGIGERLLWEQTNMGNIPHVRIGRAVLYPTDDLRRWLTKQAAEGRR